MVKCTLEVFAGFSFTRRSAISHVNRLHGTFPTRHRSDKGHVSHEKVTRLTCVCKMIPRNMIGDTMTM